MAVSAENWWRRCRDGLPPVWVLLPTLFVGVLIPLALLRLPMMYVVGAVVGGIGLALIVARPYLGMVIFLGLLYLRPEDTWPHLAAARLTLLTSLTALLAWLINALLVREPFQFRLPAVRCFLAFVVVAIGSTALSRSGQLIDTVLDLLKLLVLFLLILHLVNSEKRVVGTVVTLVLFSALLGALTIWRFQNGEALIQGDGSVRALGTGIFGDPNDLALAMAMALPLALGLGMGLGRAVAGQHWFTRLLCLACVPVFIWTIYITDSRGGILALAAAIFLYFRRRLGRVGLVLGVLTGLLFLVAGPARMSQLNAEEQSASQRLDAWHAGFQMLRSSPIWGVGMNQFTQYHPLTAHNSIVLCMAELGFAGLYAWLGLFYFACRDAGRLARPVARAGDSGRLVACRRSGSAKNDAYTVGSSPVRFGVTLKAAPAARPRWSASSLLQISLVTFLVGGFFLSRTYTPPLFVYLAVAACANRVEAGTAGDELLGAGSRDWLALAAATIGAGLFIQLFMRVVG